MLLGMDISQYQGEMDFTKAASKGIKYCIMRAGYPSKFFKFSNKDAQYDRNSSLSPLVFPSTAYWLFRPQWDGAWQADEFCKLLEDKDFFPVYAVDVELNETGVSKTSFQNQLKKYLDRMKSNGFERNLVYTRGEFWDTHVGNPTWAKFEDLWIARYYYTPWESIQDPYRPDSWFSWRFWQFTSEGDGLAYGAQSLGLDLNNFYGEQEDFNNYISGIQTPPPPTIQDNIKYKITTAKLNIRNSPIKTSTDIGDLYLNDVVQGIEVQKDALGNDWLRVGLSQWAAINEIISGSTSVYMTQTEEPVTRKTL